MKNGDKASIREVFQISTRLESKIDELDKRLSNMEGKVTILAVVWSSVISLVGIFIGYFWVKQ